MTDRPDESGPQPPEQPGEVATGSSEHDDTGLELAKSIARSLAGSRRTSRQAAAKAARPRRTADPQFSGAHPDERDPQLLDGTIGRLVAEQGWSTEVRMHGVFSRWDAIVGREVAQHCRPESFVPDHEGSAGGGRLVVRTDSTAWATNLKLLVPTVVRRLNEELGEQTVRVVDVLGPTAPSWKKGRRSVRDGRGPRDTYG